ncbi:MAG: CoB--CoM heterodisulfide reductase iron-sulfur subunit B family protein [Methylococcales bacterium]
MSKEYSFYPGCSSQKGTSGSNLQISVNAICDTLDIKLNTIPDWNCCSASIGFSGGGELPRLALSARNIALSEKNNPGQEIVATCAACWLATRETKERIEGSEEIREGTEAALKEAHLEISKEMPKVRHFTEVLVEDIGFEAMKEKVVKPLEGLKIAGYVGCQTNRPFGIDGESFENPKYLDNMVEAMGAEACTTYEKKVSCCGGALAFSEPKKSQALVKGIIEAAYDHGADMIVTPCPVCQLNVEAYQKDINADYGTKFNIPVTYYSTLMAVAYGKTAKEAGLDGLMIQSKQLNDIAAK